MRTLVIFLIAIYLFPLFVFSDVDPELCPMIMPGINENRIPNYLQPWWNNVRTGKFVVMFVDFPDGRYVNGNEKTQPFYDWQLEWVASHG